jgi:hypothetical protein
MKTLKRKNREKDYIKKFGLNKLSLMIRPGILRIYLHEIML